MALVPLSFEPLGLVLLHALVLVPGSKVMLEAEVEKETKQLICAVTALVVKRKVATAGPALCKLSKKIVNDDLLSLFFENRKR